MYEKSQAGDWNTSNEAYSRRKGRNIKVYFMKCKSVSPFERASNKRDDSRVQTCVSAALLKGCEEKR